MSGPALLAGGARCAPPSGLDPSVGFALPHTPTGGYGIRPYGLPIPLHSACRQLRRGGGTPPYILPKKGNVGRPALWPPCPLAATVNLPCYPPTLTPRRKASLVKGRCRACEAEGFLPVCGCDSVQGIARRNPSGRLRRPPHFDKGGFSAPNLKLHFKFHSCKIWQSVLQSHSIPF